MNHDSNDKKTSSELLMEVALEKIETLFKDQFGEGHVRVFVNNDHLEIIPINSNKFTRFISKSFYDTYGHVLSRETIKDVSQILQAKAEFGGTKYDLFLKVAKYNDDLYYDLTNDKHQSIRIFKNKEKGIAEWEILDKTPVPLFRRYNQIPQVLPVVANDLDTYQEHVYEHSQDKNKKDALDIFLDNLTNIKNKESKLLVKISLISYFVPDIPHIVMLVHGSKGSAKSTFQYMIKSIVEPAKPSLLTLHNNSGEFIQQLSHYYLPAYDNLKYNPKWLSDEVCKAVTGVGQTKRALYTNDEDKIYEYKHCFIFNGINVAFSEPDVLDRSIIIKLEEIDNKNRKTEEDILNEFNNLKPWILKVIFDTLAKAMTINYDVKYRLKRKGILPRMSDYAVWCEAVSQSLGNKEGQFLDIYYENLNLQLEEIIESSVVAKVLIEFMEGKAEWNGSATELHSTLTSALSDKDERLARSKSWPNSSNSLSRKINELSSTLKNRGIEISHGYDNKTKSRVIRITNTEKIPSLSSYRSSDRESGKTITEMNVFNFTNSENIEIERKSELRHRGPNSDNKIPDVHDNDDKNINRVINIYQIADRIHEHSDIWKCKRCDHRGDKWDLLSHYPNCRNNNN
ncbi:hypothetical protein [Candidatus Nitrosocosmicus sp. SS]|jgi:hypothetical protein|uniref:hypothetical protein n=1 Tax=Candidatus Nitrosocosmicus agrestis TaxID=2563600 RepID=UPI00122E988F|nr:hypothetical protein [Candidatus Nitrosocosmicus sp. SS]KAA2282968.1 hypothetical protein F1Z66_04715 [Candidatus Nitrosocosmicus sp. SS]KAF0869171.1 hypothetical protein E5N71_06995 [Candidatus Nitrosocosmicus sp. SS]